MTWALLNKSLEPLRKGVKILPPIGKTGGDIPNMKGQWMTFRVQKNVESFRGGNDDPR